MKDVDSTDPYVEGMTATTRFIMRDHQAPLFQVTSIKILLCSVPMAELIAAWRGLCTAMFHFKASQIWLKGDSLIMIFWIKSVSQFYLAPTLYPFAEGYIIAEIFHVGF